MKRSSIEWFLTQFEASDMMLEAAITLPQHMQHKNCKAAFDQYMRQNPNRVKSVCDKLLEAA